MDPETEKLLHLAVSHHAWTASLDSSSSSDHNLSLPRFRQHTLPSPSLLDLRHTVPLTGDSEPAARLRQHLCQLDPTALARLELGLEPEEILRDYLTLPQLQQITVLEDQPEKLQMEWSFPPLDFEMVLERDPFSGNPGVLREIDTNGLDMNSRNSADFRREPNQPGENYLFGSVTQMPFVPGGMEESFAETDRFAIPSAEMLEKGRESVKNFATLPLLPPEFATSPNEELFSRMQRNPALLSCHLCFVTDN